MRKIHKVYVPYCIKPYVSKHKMNGMIKKIVNSTLSKYGFKIQKVSIDKFNLDLYNLIFSKDSIERRRFYNIGAGNFFHPFWTNVDYFSDWYKSNDELTKKGMHHDLFSLDRISVDTGTVEIVYSSSDSEPKN